MLFSLAIIFLCGIILGAVFEKLRLPALLGMLLTGIILGPNALHLIDNSILSIAPDLRQIALLIILTRAGLNLRISDLKKSSCSTILLCFLPAVFEITGTLLLAPKLLNMRLLDAAILGTVIAAVSPAVIIPKMLKLMEEGYGTRKGIPQMILAGASVDDVFVIVLFTSFTGLAQGQTISPLQLLKIPTAILLGIGGGTVCGLLFVFIFRKLHLRDSLKVIILLSVSFLLVTLEKLFTGFISFSGLLAVMQVGVTLQMQRPLVAARISDKYAKLWVAAELLLFVLVGTTVDIRYAVASGGVTLLFLCGVLLFRMAGVFCCLWGSKLSFRERLFCAIAYIPKATVQAAIGGLPLAMGLPCGKTVLTVAVVSILLTAPLGSFLIEKNYKRLLSPEKQEPDHMGSV